MTKTALANKELAVKERIARDQRAHEKAENVKDRGVQVATAAIGALGRVGSASIGRKAGARGASRVAYGGIPLRNSPDWYKRVPELLGATTNLPGFYPNGIPIKGAYDTADQGRLPGVGCIYFSNTFGPTLTPNNTTNVPSATTLNLAAQRLMTELRKYNSRIGEYEPGDLLQFMLAEVEIFTFIARLGRAIQMFHYFNEYNPNVRVAALAFMGFKCDDMVDRIKDYEKLYAMMVSEANRILTVPSDLTYFHRKLMLSSNLYKEGAGDNAQIIFTEPLEGFIYNEANAALRPFTLTGANWWGVSSVRYQFQQMLNELQNSAFCTTLMADIRAAKGLDLYQMQMVDLEHPELKEIDEVLTQFMNAELIPLTGNPYTPGTGMNSASSGNFGIGGTIVQSALTFSVNAPAAIINGLSVSKSTGTDDLIPHYYINQNTNGSLIQTLTINGTTLQDYRIYQGHTNSSGAIAACDINVNNLNKSAKLLNFFKNDVSSDDILVATRLTPTWHWGSVIITTGDPDYYFEARGCATEVPICFCFGNGNVTNFDCQFGFANYYSYDSMAFNYKPTIYILQSISGQYYTVHGKYPVQQWDKVVELTRDNAYWLHEMSVKSEIYVNPPSGFKLD